MCWMLAVDWNAAGSVVGGVGDLLAGTATVALAYLGYKGLSSWRDQLKGTRKIEVGHNLLMQAYEASEVSKYITAPFMGAGELGKIERLSGESEESYRLRQNYEAISNRYLEHIDVFNKLRASCFAAKAVLGDDVYAAAVALVQFPQHILASASTLKFKQQVINRLSRQMELGMDVNARQWNDANDAYNAASDYFHKFDEEGSLDAKREAIITAIEEVVRKAIS